MDNFVASSDIQSTVACSDVVLITVLSFMFKNTIDKIGKFLKPSAIVGIIPGTGGCEFYCQGIISKGHVVFGLDRVPHVARLKKYGEYICASKKDKVRLSAMPTKETKNICKLIEQLININCSPLNNYLTVTLTPSNPILHTARLYSMFKDYDKSVIYKRNIYFYKEWDIKSSDILLRCDDELQKICDAVVDVDLTEVISLKEHYESENAEQLTQKLSTIQSLSKIFSPMIEIQGGYIPDLKSRYFLEDFPFGLCIIKDFAEICKVQVPTIDLILKWYQSISGKNWYVDDNFSGKGLIDLPIPSNFGLKKIDDIYRFYIERMN